MQPAGAGERDTPSAELFRQLVLLLANATAITALLVYFGWARTQRQAEMLGIDESLLGGSTQTLVLRSIRQVLLLLLGIAVLGLAAYGLDHWARQRAASGWRPSTGFIWAIAALGVALPVIDVTIVDSLDAMVGFAGWPISLALGFGLGVATVRLIRLRGGHDPKFGSLPRLFIMMILSVLAFWTATNIATIIADANANAFIEHRSPERIPVTIVSTDRLWLSGPGIVEQQLDEDHYRYTGLELLDRDNGRILLIPKGWQPGNSQVIILSESEKMYFSFG